MHFSASYDTFTKIITPSVTGIMMAIGISLHTITPGAAKQTGYFTIAALLATFLISLAYAPKSYSVDEGCIYINRILLPPVIIKIENILSAAPVSRQSLRGSIRVFGAGGFFGYFGKFANKSYGKMTWYATNLQNAVLIKTQDNKKYVITPDNRDVFLNAIKHT
ncbi:MAG: PH domain-containing protein [Niabella sp.]